MTESVSRPPSSDPRLLAPVREGETVAEKYLIGKLIDVGGMGAVFEARDTRLDRRVAIKVLLPRLVSSATAAERFKREARAATRITSEHVVKVLEIGDLQDRTPFLVMEYLEGQDLRAVLREHGPLPPRQAVDYVLQALQAVAEGHMAAVIHRDLKPSNLFLTERADGTPLIKVLDFGIAKTLQLDSLGDFALTSSDDIQLGSPTYMPPEQFQNPRDVDARADIWALGVTLYELISGRVPFQGHTYAELISHVLSGEPESIESVPSAPAMPDGLQAIISQCLAKNRDLRFENAVALAVALAPYGSDDARLSLTRVSGLARPRSPNPVGSARETQMGYEATLPVPVDGEPRERTPSRSSDARQAPSVVPPPPKRWRSAIVIAAVTLGAVSATWYVARPKAPPSPAAARPLAPSLSAAQTASGTATSRVDPGPSVTVAVQPVQAAAGAASESAAPKSAPLAAHTKAPPVAPAKPKAELSTPSAASAAPPPASNTPPLGASSAPPPSSPSAPPTQAPGLPSKTIEELIETRH